MGPEWPCSFSPFHNSHRVLRWKESHSNVSWEEGEGEPLNLGQVSTNCFPTVVQLWQGGFGRPVVILESRLRRFASRCTNDWYPSRSYCLDQRWAESNCFSVTDSSYSRPYRDIIIDVRMMDVRTYELFIQFQCDVVGEAIPCCLGEVSCSVESRLNEGSPKDGGRLNHHKMREP